MKCATHWRRRASAGLLAGLALASGLLFGGCRREEPLLLPEPPAEIPRLEQSFGDIAYERPDIPALDAKLDEAIRLAEENADAGTLLTLYEEIMGMLRELDTASALISVRSDLDLNDAEKLAEKTLLDNEATRLDNRMNELTSAILASGAGDTARAAWGEDYVARFEQNSKLNSPEIEGLVAQEIDIVDRYKAILAEETTIDVGGVAMTQMEILSSDLTLAEMAWYYYAIQDERNAALGPFYLQLTELWRQEAEILGFASAKEYGYASMGHDFTPEEATALAEEVREKIAPLVAELEAEWMDYQPEEHDLSLERGLSILQQSLANGYPAEMTEALDYMLTYGMYDFSDTPGKSMDGYTTILSGYRAPFLFLNPAGYGSATTVFHEFGHYANFYSMPAIRWNDNNDLSLAEVHSQGLELLMHDAYPTLYGADADYYAAMNLLDILNAVLQGCIEDQFQQQTVDAPDMTLEEMNELHGQLFQDYYGVWNDTWWTEIHHLYGAPFYYISYATSALSALDIWLVAREDPDGAKEIYAELMGQGLNSGYRDTLQECGLDDPFSEGFIDALVDGIREEMGLSAGAAA